MARSPRPDDLYAFRIPNGPRLTPDGRQVVFTLQTVAPRRDGYRHSLWIADADTMAGGSGRGPGGSATAGLADVGARQLTVGHRHDRAPRPSPDGRWLAFLSDRRSSVEDEPQAPRQREDLVQVYLLGLDGAGEARRLTDLPAGVTGLEWSPDGRQLVILSGSARERRRRAGRGSVDDSAPPTSDVHYVDRLSYLANGEGFIYHRPAHLWLVDVETGAIRRLTSGATPDQAPSWSPDGTRIAFAANRHRDADLVERSDVYVLEVEGGRTTRLTGGPTPYFGSPAWLPDGRTVAALGHRFPARAGSRNDLWLFAADGSDAGAHGGRNLSAAHDLMPDAGIGSDVVPDEPNRLLPSPDGQWLTFRAPVDGSADIWRIHVADGRLERLTNGRHFISSVDQVGHGRGMRLAYLQADPTHLSDVYVLDVPPGGRRSATAATAGTTNVSPPRRITALNDAALADIALVEPVERWLDVDGRRIQGWLYAAATTATSAASATSATKGAAKADRGRTSVAPPPPLVTEIHGGPHTCYAWAPVWEFQVLAGAGLSVWCSNPRGSTGYGQDFNAANYRDWAVGPTRDVLAGVESLVADGLADPARLGLTGGSYGGYLTNWIVAHDQRFRAAMTCRSVSDVTILMLTGDISGGEFGRQEFGVAPWDDPDYYREISPLTYAGNIHTPLLIQHSENDIRCTIAQAEALFTVLRSRRRPVRLMRVPDETHELTRSGTPFRRVENLVQVRSWFSHYLVDGRRGLPPLPRERAGI